MNAKTLYWWNIYSTHYVGRVERIAAHELDTSEMGLMRPWIALKRDGEVVAVMGLDSVVVKDEDVKSSQ